MQSIELKANILPVTVILHWPDRWCSYCLQETETVATILYWCPSCNRYTAGRTEYVEAKAHLMNNA